MTTSLMHMPDDEPREPPFEKASVRWARLLGLPEPKPFTAEQEAAYQRKMDEADAAIAARLARQAARST